MTAEDRLPGEVDSETSPLLEDAEHWLSVYQELLTFKRTLVRTAELERLENRHRFWQERVRQLQELASGSAGFDRVDSAEGQVR